MALLEELYHYSWLCGFKRSCHSSSLPLSPALFLYFMFVLSEYKLSDTLQCCACLPAVLLPTITIMNLLSRPVSKPSN